MSVSDQTAPQPPEVERVGDGLGVPIKATDSRVRRVLSLGAGVQSTTLLLMAADRLIEPWEVAVFADTGGEPAYVYEHLARLASYAEERGIPVVKVSQGSLLDDTLTKKSVSPPLWVKKADGKPGGPGFRGCTDRYKVRPIDKWLRQFAAVPRGCKDVRVQLGIGISTDEATRQKDSGQAWIKHTYPLINLGFSRSDCRRWLDEKGWGETPKSACTYCPYHSGALWAEVKALDPQGWTEAVLFDRAVREGTRQRDEEGATFFLHRDLVPLDQAELPAYVPGAADEGVGCSPFACPGDTLAGQLHLWEDDAA